MDDLIKRQNAIDAMVRLQREDEECYGASIPEGFDGDRAVEAINAIPSAQLEIIQCKDCKFWTHIKRTNRYWCKTDDGLYDLNPSPEDFCSRAERRTDG